MITLLLLFQDSTAENIRVFSCLRSTKCKQNLFNEGLWLAWDTHWRGQKLSEVGQKLRYDRLSRVLHLHEVFTIFVWGVYNICMWYIFNICMMSLQYLYVIYFLKAPPSGLILPELIQLKWHWLQSWMEKATATKTRFQVFSIWRYPYWSKDTSNDISSCTTMSRLPCNCVHVLLYISSCTCHWDQFQPVGRILLDERWAASLLQLGVTTAWWVYKKVEIITS